jgi:Protein kinase domain
MIAAGPHATDAELEAYIVGAHAGEAADGAAAFERHLEDCEPCRTRAARAAAVEGLLEAAAAAASFCPGCTRVLEGALCGDCGAAASAGAFVADGVIVRSPHGRVYRAHDAEGRVVALKELAFVHAPTPEALAAFEREARVLRLLSHPRIPRFVDAFTEGQGVGARLYLAQEFIEGESLAVELQRGAFGEPEARALAEQVLEVLVYLQGLSPPVFHRDIKPANLIRRQDGAVALVDFGAARDLGATVGATLVGTFGYMPVEQLGGIVDSTSDLYALGATLYHALSRREPWRAMDDAEAIARLQVSASFRTFLSVLMARRPEDRFRNAAAALEALHRPSTRPAAHRRRAVRAVAAAALASTAALGLGVTFRLGMLRGQRSGPGRRVVENVVRTEAAGVWKGGRMDMDFYNADIHSVLGTLAAVGQVKLVTSDAVRGKLTMKMNDVPWDQALDAIVRTQHLQAIWQGNVIRVEPVGGLDIERPAGGGAGLIRRSLLTPFDGAPPRRPFVAFESYPLDLIRLVGTVRGATPCAMFTSPAGNGAVVGPGNLVGKEAARIIEIRSDRVILELSGPSGAPERRELTMRR